MKQRRKILNCVLWCMLVALPLVAFSFDKKRAGFAVQQPATAFCEMTGADGTQYTLDMLGLKAFIVNGHIQYVLYKAERKGGQIIRSNYTIDLQLVGADTTTAVVAENQLGAITQQQVNGKPVSVRWVQQLTYKNVYPNIDWILRIDRGQLTYDFVVHRGGDASRIKVMYAHAQDVQLQADGGITITAAGDEINEEAPRAYEEDAKRAIGVAYKVNSNTVTYTVAPYTGTLIINKP